MGNKLEQNYLKVSLLIAPISDWLRPQIKLPILIKSNELIGLPSNNLAF